MPMPEITLQGWKKQEQYRTPLENYNHYCQCLANNSYCDETPKWEEKRDFYRKIIVRDRNTIEDLKNRVEILEHQVQELTQHYYQLSGECWRTK